MTMYRDSPKQTSLPKKSSFYRRLKTHLFSSTFEHLELKRQGYCRVCRNVLITYTNGLDRAEYGVHLRLSGRLRGCTCCKIIDECRRESCGLCYRGKHGRNKRVA